MCEALEKVSPPGVVVVVRSILDQTEGGRRLTPNQDTWVEADMLTTFYYICGSVNVCPFLVEIDGAEGSIQDFFEDLEKVEILSDESRDIKSMEGLEWIYLDSLEESSWESECAVVDTKKDNCKKVCKWDKESGFCFDSRKKKGKRVLH